MDAPAADLDAAARYWHEALACICDDILILDREDRLCLAEGNLFEKYPQFRQICAPGTPYEVVIRRLAENGFYGDTTGGVENLVRRHLKRPRKRESYDHWFADGRCYRIIATPIPNGHAIGRIDITEHRILEHPLDSEAAGLGALLAQVPDLLLVLDPADRIVDALGSDDQVLLGLRQALLGQALAQAAPPDLLRQLTSAVADSRATGQPRLLSAITRTGPRPRQIDVRIAPMSGARISLCLRETSAHRQIVNELFQARAELTRLRHRRTHYLAAASHDLRQPLQALTMFLGALAAQDLPDRARYMVERLEVTVDSLAELLNRLLDLSRLDADVIQPKPGPVNLARLLGRLADEFVPLAARKGLDLRVVPSTVTVHSDVALLENILRNLIGNAVRYTESGRVLIGCRRQPDGVAVQVHDTGPGIPLAEQARVFREFERLENDTSGEGLGLGLAIVERTCRLLGHRVTLTSTPGHGTCFSVTLPMAG